jgi:peptide/nickel transport system substrate-binding protein
MPWLRSSQGENFVDVQIFSRLVELSPDPAKLNPALADSWKLSGDKLSYTFHLRPGVKFSNGQPLKASDVKFTLENAANPKVDPLSSILLGGLVKSVSIPDPTHVRVDLKQASPALPYYLALVAILPEDLVKKMGAKAFGVHPVGTGPFMVTQFSPGSPTIVLKRNPYYWQKGLPYLDGITYKYIPDDTARMLAVESGSVDVADQVPYSQVDRVTHTSGVKLFAQRQLANDWLVINGFKAPLSKVAVRQALAYATPFDQISKVAFHGLAPVAPTASMQTKYFDTSIKPYPYDVAKARRLLTQAGQKSLPLTLTIVQGDAVGKQVATILQAAWAKAGIHLTIQPKDDGAVLAAAGAEKFDLIMYKPNETASDVPVDDEYATALANAAKPGAYPWMGWNNPEATRSVQRAITSFNESVRKQAFSQYQKLLSEQQPIIGLVYPPNLFAIRTNVHNFVAAPTSWPLLAETWLSH